MRNTMIIAVYFLMSSTMQAMDDPAQQGLRDVNEAIFIMMNNPLSYQDILDIDFLFQEDADPNFASPGHGTTHLMRAVSKNQLSLIRLLINRDADVDAHNTNYKYVRDFNLIYSKKKLMNVVRPITEAMLEIETHNDFHPYNSLDCKQLLYSMNESRKLREALVIDTILQDRAAFSGVIDTKHPLLNLLRKQPRVQRALGYIVDRDCEGFPVNIPVNVRVFYVVGDEKLIG